MITGDLNAGKSTLINALTGQSILPTDQQPCTQAFCEIIPSGSDFSVVAFSEKEQITLTMDQLKHELQNEACPYSWFKLHIPAPKYLTSPTATLTLIDSPGLNTDQIKTTCLFTQQQEIDVIVFVINASFHLTLSGRQFLQQAAKERQKIFFIVNKYDEIVNVEKCRSQILKQIQEVMPEMSIEDKESLIHFISAKRVLQNEEEPVEEKGEMGKEMEEDEETKKKEQEEKEETETIPYTDDVIESNEINVNEHNTNTKPPDFKTQFETMKQSLLDFVFLKRSISKLSPAKTYSTRLLQDLLELSAFNIRKLTSDSHGLMTRLEVLSPQLQEKEHHLPQLRSDLNAICDYACLSVKEASVLEASCLRNHFIKLISNQPFGNILQSRRFVNEIFKQGRKEYTSFTERITNTTRNIGNNAISEMHRIAHKQGIPVDDSIPPFDFTFPARLPLPQPALLDLIDPQSLLQHFGILNVASLASGLLAYQPLLNVCYQLASRLGISPLLIGGVVFGGLSLYLGHLASSSIEASIRGRLLSLFSTSLNDDLIGEGCQQAVFVYLAARSSTLVSAYLTQIEQSRREASLLRSKHESIADEILFLKDLSRRIEALLQQSHLINL